MPPVIEEIESSPEGSPIKGSETAALKQASPVLGSKQASTESSPLTSLRTPFFWTWFQEEGFIQIGLQTKPVEEPKSKRVKTSSLPSANLAKFLKRSVVRGKIVKVAYFKEQGLKVFLDKLRSQGWLELFTNTQLGCSQPKLAEFYTKVSFTEGTVTSEVNGVQILFDAQKLGKILRILAVEFDIYVREDKSLLDKARLLNLAQRLSQQPGLKHPQPVKKGDMAPLHQLLFWFIIKNIIPRGQGRNQADAMDQCFTDLMDRSEQLNLPTIMIRHIARIANTTREHDLGYGSY